MKVRINSKDDVTATNEGSVVSSREGADEMGSMSHLRTSPSNLHRKVSVDDSPRISQMTARLDNSTIEQGGMVGKDSISAKGVNSPHSQTQPKLQDVQEMAVSISRMNSPAQ